MSQKIITFLGATSATSTTTYTFTDQKCINQAINSLSELAKSWGLDN